MIKSLLKIIFYPLIKIFKTPRFRYSSLYCSFQSLFNYNDREEILKKIFFYLKSSKIDGDYLEFGVYEGDTFIAAYHLAQFFKFKKMRFYAFDSFAGLPVIEGIDVTESSIFSEGQYKCSLNKFKKNLKKSGVNLKKIKTIKGFYKNTLNRTTLNNLSIKKAAVIFIDCDIYESTVCVLNFIIPYLQQGTIILLDDWFCFGGNYLKGEQRAFSEWLEKNPQIIVREYLKFGWHGNSFIINTINKKV